MRQRGSTLFFSHFQPYLTVLAFVDSFMILMFLLDNVIIGNNTMSNNNWFYTVVPYLTYPIKNISITMSMVWVVVIAMKRFLAITQPFNDHTKDSLYGYVIFLIIFSITVNFSK
jgi:hypothetical protein